MFIREKTTPNPKPGTTYVKHTLVESYHTPNGTRQRTIMQLGKLSLAKKYWPILAKELENRLSGSPASQQKTLFPSRKTSRVLGVDKQIQTVANEALEQYHYRQNNKKKQELRKTNQELKVIDLNSATTTFYRSLGAELVGHHLWNSLKFPDILKECGFSARERSLSEAVVLGRLIRPGSDLSTWNWIRNHSSIGELTETSIERVKKDAVYEIADQLWNHKSVLEKHLLKREKELFPNRGNLYLFDLTNFYFEGQALQNEIAFYAKSKEKRDDCPLVSLALVVDQDGFPVTSRVYEGNIGEPTTLRQILKDMGYLSKNQQSEFSPFQPTMVMDRGIATEENVKLLGENQLPYIVIERCPREKEYGDQFSEYQETFERIPTRSPDVWIRKVPGSDEKTCRILCLSEGRKAKEKAMAERWEDRAEDDLKRFQSSIEKGSIKAIENGTSTYGTH
jgi:flagellar motility protein MotE (MotC chaperone)